jgi:hypothetical protein
VRHPEVVIGAPDGNRVVIHRQTSNDRESWFHAAIAVHCDGWYGQFKASFMRGELSRLAQDVRALYQRLDGEAVLDPVEPNLVLSLTGDGKGHVRVRGTAQNRLSSGTHLSFEFQIDQTYLPAISKSLSEMDP